MSVVQIENLRIEIPADARQEGEVPPSSPQAQGSWSDVVAEQQRVRAEEQRAYDEAAREEYWALRSFARTTMLQQRAQRQEKEARVLQEALDAILQVDLGKAQAQFCFDTQRMYDLGVAIQANMIKAGMRGKLGGRLFSMSENCVSVGFTDGGDNAAFYLNPLTGQIGVNLGGSGGLGGNEWYVIAMHRPGSETQLRAKYAGEYIVDLVREIAVMKC